jgi:hypothetical protein
MSPIYEKIFMLDFIIWMVGIFVWFEEEFEKSI